ncbi:MAG: lytic transglycosylase domain-containing protein [Bryobacteraceae bacterium]
MNPALCILLMGIAFGQQATPNAANNPQRAAMNKQIEAVRRQAAALGLRLQLWGPGPAPLPAIAEPPAYACPPIPDETVSPILQSASKAQSVDISLLRAVIGQESAFHPCAVSSKGAQGLMQLMPEVASRLGVKDVFDPRQNVEAGAQYLKELLGKYKGDLSRTLAAYNAGPTAVDQANGIPDIPETRQYVESILGHLNAKSPPDTAK